MHDRSPGPLESGPSRVFGPVRRGWAGLSLPCRAYLGLVAFSLAGSALSRATGLDAGWVGRVAALVTLAMGVGTVLRALGPGAKTWPFALLIGAASEVCGLYTGLPFGAYAYTDAWWPTVPLPGGHRFPVALPFAWLMMAGAGYLVAARWARRPGTSPAWWAVPLGGVLAALADVPMEPVMAGPLGYWRWLEPGPLPGGAPVANFVGWVVVSAAAGAVLRLGPPPPDSREPLIVLLVHSLFVVALGALLVVG